MRHKGFTLIELLVVIAIIGMLSSIVIGSLNTARTKGNDSVVQADMVQIRSQAELYYDNQTTGGTNGTFGSNASCGADGQTGNTFVFSDSKIKAILRDVKANADPSALLICNTDSSGQKWAVSISKLRNANTSWCLDNSGYAKAGTASGGSCN
jgi:prepilin-type N-terminal cleavage/methylation domain-containing protein